LTLFQHRHRRDTIHAAGIYMRRREFITLFSGVAVILRIGSWPNLPATFEFMRQGLKDLGYVALSIVFMSFATVASAGPKEDVAAATLAWTRALGEDVPDMMLSLYSDDAVLLGDIVADVTC
jgi:hypothetical protein